MDCLFLSDYGHCYLEIIWSKGRGVTVILLKSQFCIRSNASAFYDKLVPRVCWTATIILIFRYGNCGRDLKVFLKSQPKIDLETH